VCHDQCVQVQIWGHSFILIWQRVYLLTGFLWGEEKGKRLIRITEYNLLKSPLRLLALFWLPVCRAAGELVNVTVGSSTLTSQLGGCFHNCQSMSTTSWIRKRQKKQKQTDENHQQHPEKDKKDLCQHHPKLGVFFVSHCDESESPWMGIYCHIGLFL
jgi:hypothetical protein